MRSGTDGTTAYMTSQGLPLPTLAALVAIVVECLGGMLILIGHQARATGLVLALWSVATALVAHTHFSDPNQTINFLKNLAIAGGFLQLVAFGGGAWSIDALGSRRSP
jgi:putative oxidoreductase